MNVRINNNTFNVEVNNTEEEIKRGMMGRENLNGAMLFNVGKGYHSFWMKNCLIPLDIVFISNNRISKIHQNCQPCDECSERYTGIGDKVLEFPADTTKGWKVGDKVFFSE